MVKLFWGAKNELLAPMNFKSPEEITVNMIPVWGLLGLCTYEEIDRFSAVIRFHIRVSLFIIDIVLHRCLLRILRIFNLFFKRFHRASCCESWRLNTQQSLHLQATRSIRSQIIWNFPGKETWISETSRWCWMRKLLSGCVSGSQQQ